MNQHGYCEHCGANFDAEKVIDTLKHEGYTDDQALAAASNYPGFKKYGVENKRDLRIYVKEYTEKGKLIYYKCPFCDKMLS